MTKELEHNLLNNLSPFNTFTLKPELDLEIDDLRETLLRVLKFIQMYYPNEKLYISDDWHEHDGFITDSKTITIDTILKKMKTNKSFYQWRNGAHEVYKLINPESYNFMLRFYIMDLDDNLPESPGIWGTFTFSACGAEVNELKKWIGSKRPETFGTKQYFELNSAKS